MSAQDHRIEEGIRASIHILESLLVPVRKRSAVSVIISLVHRASETSEADGFPRGGAPERSSSAVSDPTLASVMVRDDDVCLRCVEGIFTLEDGRKVECRTCQGTGRRWADPVPGKVADLLHVLAEVRRLTAQVDHKRKELNRPVDMKQGRESSLQGHCLACGEAVSGVGEDRLKRGCCPRHYPKWLEWRKAHEGTDPITEFQMFVASTKVPVAVAAGG